MVELLRAPSLGQTMAGPLDMMGMTSRFSDVRLASIHEMKEMRSGEEQQSPGKVSFHGRPRRAFSSNDYRLLRAPSTPGTSSLVIASPTPSPSSKQPEADSYFQLVRIPTALTPIPSSPIVEAHNKSAEVSLSVSPGHVPATRYRPALPSPQRSYSVMDYEPIPFTQRPGEKLTLTVLPPEIHCAIFDFLEPIDSTCFGLTSRHFYAVRRRMQPGPISLSARREGPNNMEWAWRLAGPLIAAGATREDVMAKLLPKGQVYCRKCGISRCELHRHLQEWFGNGYEYCEVRQKFGPKAEGSNASKKSCYRSSPRHPHRCGRHMKQQRTIKLV